MGDIEEILELLEPDPWGQAEERPTWSKPCERCGTTVERWRGQGDVSCGHCGAEYNAGGQRLRDDWRGNPSAWDDEVGDLEGYEIQHSEEE